MIKFIQKKYVSQNRLLLTVMVFVVLTVIWKTSATKAENVDRNDGHEFSESSVIPEAELYKFIASDGGLSDIFGARVDIDGDTLIIGAPRARGTNGFVQGAVYVFVRAETNWIFQAKLKPAEESINDNFGSAIAISGNTVVVGAQFADIGTNPTQGEAYIFVRNGSDWSLQQRIFAAEGVGNAQFGISVAIDADTIIVGAFMDRILEVQKGAAYIFTRNNGNWTQQAKLFDALGNASDQFGYSVGIDNETAIVSSRFGDVGEITSGTACVFHRADGNWTQQARLSPSAGGSNFNFGISVAVDAETVIVGANRGNVTSDGNTGSAYIFVRNAGIWSEQQQLIAADGAAGDLFGESVDIFGETAIVGAWRDAIVTNNGEGSAYIFSRSGGIWRQQSKLFASDGAQSDNFGASVAISGNRIIIGAPGDDIGTNSNQGSAYLFNKSPSAPDLQAANDTGISNTDNITSHRNLSFDIGGTTVGINVELLRNGTVVSSTIAAGDSVNLTDSNLPPDGIFQYTTRQIVNGEASSLSEVTTVTIDNTAPTAAVNQSSSQVDPTSGNSVVFTAVFSEIVSNFEPSDVSLAGSTANVSAVSVVLSGTDSSYNISVNNIISDGQFIRAGIPGGAFADLAGNSGAASTSVDSTVTVDNVRPRVTINQAANQNDPTTTLPVNFTVIFSEPVTGFAPIDISLIGSSANMVGATVTITGSGSTYNVAIGNFVSNGQFVRPLVRANGALDALGNGNLVSTGTDYTVTVNNSNRVQVFDFDGDRRTDISIFRPSSGEWWLSRSSDGGDRAFQFGSASDKLVPADYTGDGKTDVAFWRPSTGEWFILRSDDFSFYAFPFGNSGDMPIVGDFDGDGRADAGVFRASNLTWYIQKSSGGTLIQQFGSFGDVPVVGDYDGDGRADIAVFRSNGIDGAEWWIKRSASDSVFAATFGNATDKAVQGDYTGDGKTDIAIFRESNGNWFILRSEDFSFYAFPFGSMNDIPVAGDYDGDGRFDVGVFRPTDRNWYIQRSTQGTLIQQFGVAGDLPIPGSFVP